MSCLYMPPIRFMIWTINFVYLNDYYDGETTTPKRIENKTNKILLMGDELFCLMYAIFNFKKNRNLRFFYSFSIYNEEKEDNYFRFNTSRSLLKILCINDSDMSIFKGDDNKEEDIVITRNNLTLFLWSIIQSNAISMTNVDLDDEGGTLHNAPSIQRCIEYFNIGFSILFLDGMKLPILKNEEYFQSVHSDISLFMKKEYVVDITIPSKKKIEKFSLSQLRYTKDMYIDQFKFEELISSTEYTLRIFVSPENIMVNNFFQGFLSSPSHYFKQNIQINELPQSIREYFVALLMLKKEFSEYEKTELINTNLTVFGKFPLIFAFKKCYFYRKEDAKDVEYNYFPKKGKIIYPTAIFSNPFNSKEEDFEKMLDFVEVASDKF